MILISVNSWARRWYIYAVAVLILCAPVLGYWALDRELPTRFVGLESVKQEGHTVLLVQDVRRTRACDTEVPLRYIESPLGARMYLQPVSLSSSEMERMQKDSPNEVRLLLQIPEAKLAPHGQWSYHVELEYRCNPIHVLWPIRDRYSFNFPVGA